jgi:phage I-like protein
VDRLITAAFTSALSSDVPDEIVYIPDGSSKIRPSVNGKAADITVNIPDGKGDAVAATMQAALVKRLAENVRPVIAFDHATTGPAAAIPVSFRYEKGRGLILKNDWTNAGRNAVSGRDFSYFSPAFLVDANGVPSGLPARGEIGSLLNNPAFRNIERIAANDETPVIESPTSPTMKTVLAALNIDPAHADAESSAAQRVEVLKAAETKLATIEASHAAALKVVTDKLEASENLVKAAAETRAKDLVKAAQLDGRIKPADDKAVAFWEKMVAAGDADAEAALAALPKGPDLTTPIVKAANGAPVPRPASKFEEKAQALVTAKEAATIDDAFGIVAAAEPELYVQYQEALRA